MEVVPIVILEIVCVLGIVIEIDVAGNVEVSSWLASYTIRL